MTTFDFSPLFRSSIGFDRLNRLMDSADRLNQGDVSYPPYNIEKTDDDHYRITMAVAGFEEEELDITVKENVLYISGKADSKDAQREFLHRGIAKRAFERRFELADFIRVTGASLENGLLHVELVREVPEAQKPRRIAISSAKTDDKAKTIDHKAA